MRVGELTRLNISYMNFQERSCIVLGKGDSEREVYFSAKNIYRNIIIRLIFIVIFLLKLILFL